MKLFNKIFALAIVVISISFWQLSAQTPNLQAQKKLINYIQTNGSRTFEQADNAIKNFISQGADVNYGSFIQDHPLIVAIEADNPTMIYALYKNNAPLKVVYKDKEMEAYRVAELKDKSDKVMLLLFNLKILQKYETKLQQKDLTPTESGLLKDIYKTIHDLVWPPVKEKE